jgi:hypothetical protein
MNTGVMRDERRDRNNNGIDVDDGVYNDNKQGNRVDDKEDNGNNVDAEEIKHDGAVT